MLSFETLWFMKYLDTLAEKSNNIKPLSSFDINNNDFDKAIYYDDRPGRNNMLVYNISPEGKPCYLKNIYPEIAVSKAVWPLSKDGSPMMNKMPSILIYTEDSSIGIKVKNGKWTIDDFIYD